MQKLRVAAVVLSGVIAGCGVGDEPRAEAQVQARPKAGPSLLVHQLQHPTAVAMPPASLQCVSQPSQLAGESVLHVDRGTLTFDGATATVELHRAPLFDSHNGVPETQALASTTPQPATVALGADVKVTETGVGGNVLSLHRSGLVWVGTVAGPLSASMTCWNNLELFGSPWSGQGGALTAKLDWTTGECKGPDGAAALNALPIEVVRETRQGECVDLSGASLTGGDFANPDLSGWYLPGARLDGAQLFLANLSDATLNGAHLGALDFGYATIAGSVDANTVLPSGCVTQNSPWGSETVSCSQ